MKVVVLHQTRGPSKLRPRAASRAPRDAEIKRTKRPRRPTPGAHFGLQHSSLLTGLQRPSRHLSGLELQSSGPSREEARRLGGAKSPFWGCLRGGPKLGKPRKKGKLGLARSCLCWGVEGKPGKPPKGVTISAKPVSGSLSGALAATRAQWRGLDT